MLLEVLKEGKNPYCYPFVFFLTYICNIAFYLYFWVT